jgi:5,6,7,8-tetrahydromethanopterin hydro-lyase
MRISRKLASWMLQFADEAWTYCSTKKAIARAIGGDPKAAEVIAKRNLVKHPFAA